MFEFVNGDGYKCGVMLINVAHWSECKGGMHIFLKGKTHSIFIVQKDVERFLSELKECFHYV